MEINAATFQYLARGADLMLPGVYLPSEGLNLVANARMAVVIRGSNIPVAVGYCAKTVNITKREHMADKGLHITHFFGDQLYLSGSTSLPASGSAPPETSDQPFDEEELANLEAAQVAEAGVEQVSIVPPAELSSSAPSEFPTTKQSEESSTAPIEPGQVEQEVEEEDGEAESTSEAISVEEMDSLIKRSFYQALKRRLKEKDLPMLVSKFWAEQCIPCRPRGTHLNLQKSSWKKLLTFLEEQVRDGVICINTTDQGVTSLVAIVRDNPALEGFRTMAVHETAEGEALENPEPTEEDSKPVIQEFWTLHKKLEFLLLVAQSEDDEDVDDEEDETIQTLKAHLDQRRSNGPRYFTQPQLTSMLRDYLTLRKLDHPTDPKLVNLDLNLANALFAGKKQAGESVSKADLSKAYKDKLVQVQMVTLNGQVIKIEKGNAVGSITLLIEARGGSKIVSRIQGLHHFGLDLKDVAKKASKKFASSAGTGKDAQGHDEILLQGNLEKTGPTFLNQEFGIPLKHIKVDVKGNVKKKR
jgi:translation initiation factor 1 (eIF-1/SUI1)